MIPNQSHQCRRCFWRSTLKATGVFDESSSSPMMEQKPSVSQVPFLCFFEGHKRHRFIDQIQVHTYYVPMNMPICYMCMDIR